MWLHHNAIGKKNLILFLEPENLYRTYVPEKAEITN